MATSLARVSYLHTHITYNTDKCNQMYIDIANIYIYVYVCICLYVCIYIYIYL